MSQAPFAQKLPCPHCEVVEDKNHDLQKHIDKGVGIRIDVFNILVDRASKAFTSSISTEEVLHLFINREGVTPCHARAAVAKANQLRALV